jgi:N-acetylglutamate synthase-like GNAT family acetyltransferase
MIVRPKVRFATNEDARDVQEILNENGQIPGGHDWSDLGYSWLVAEYDDTIIGCVQVIVGKPFGHIGFLAVLPGYYNGGAGAVLWRAAENLLANSGCDGYTGMTTNEQVLDKFPKRGGIIFGDPVRLLFKRVYRKGIDYGRRL